MTILKYHLSKISTPATTNIQFTTDIYDNVFKYFTTDDNIFENKLNIIHPSIIWDICIHNPLYYSANVIKYFNIDIIFDSYTYKSYYDSGTNTFIRKITKKNYNIFLYVNLEKIIKCKSITVLNILSKLFSLVQMNYIRSKKTYITNSIEQFITEREHSKLYLDKIWYNFRMNSLYLFDMKNKKIISDRISPQKIFFNRYGGIIETNNIEKLIELNFKNNIYLESDLILLPIKLCYLWETCDQITFEKLHQISISEIGSYIRGKKYNRLFIHECDEKILPMIKIIADIINPKIIWILNSLPLYYYFGNGNKLNLNNLLSISNLWLCFNNHQKKIYKIELLRMLFVNFNKLYTKYYYEETVSNSKINLYDKCNWIEKYIYDKINSYYFNWKNKLHIDVDNIYSMVTQNKFSKIELAISNMYLQLINQIIPKSDMHKIILNGVYHNENNLCPICCDTDNPIQAILETCGHQFCFDCITRSIATSLKCPICRAYCDLKSIFIYVTERNISDGLLSYLNSTLKSSSGLITSITSIPFFETHIDNKSPEEIIVMEKNISVHTMQLINHKCLNNKKIKIVYMEL